MSVIKGYPARNSSPTTAEIITTSVDSTSQKAGLDVRLLGNLVPRDFDHITLAYTGANLTSVTYRVGGGAGTTICTLTLGYSGSTLTTISRSLP